MDKKTISVYSCINNAIDNEFTLFEGIESALAFADEVVIVDGGSKDGTMQLLFDKYNIEINSGKLSVFHNQWEEKMGKHMLALQKNIALSHCESDYCLLMDADEVFHEKDIEHIKQLVEQNADNPKINVWVFNTWHFYRDYDKINVNPYYYKNKAYMFKNFMGFHHGSCSSDTDDEIITFNRKNARFGAGYADIDVFHYSKVRSDECMNKKYNIGEKMFHPDWQEKQWEWDMKDTVFFTKCPHPKYMEKRIECNKDREKIKELYSIKE